MIHLSWNSPSFGGQGRFGLLFPLLIHFLCLFYRCAHCRAMSEDWAKLANDFAGHPVAFIGQVDCTSDEGSPVCEDFDIGVRTYIPTLEEISFRSRFRSRFC